MSVDADRTKGELTAMVTRHRDRALALSHRIHASPEVGYEEEKAAGWLCDELAELGYDVQATFCDLPTAFLARTGDGPLHIALLAEYDALPGVGHACGHNVIAAAAYGAAAALAPVVDDLSITVSVIGTPAEEVLSNGGKIVMLERGAFDDVDAAMMIHPTPFEFLCPETSAAQALEVVMTGKPAHAAAAPERGVNAGDAMTVAQVAIGLLRQQLPADVRVSGITTKGGDAANVIPDRTEAEYVLRAKDTGELSSLTERVTGCFQAGALATGCDLVIEGGHQPYAELRSNPELAAAYEANAVALGRRFDSPELLKGFVPSTDAGNVSHHLPLIHPYVGLGSWPVVNHQPEFAALCATPIADDALLAGAAALARTAADLALDDSLRERVMTSRERMQSA